MTQQEILSKLKETKIIAIIRLQDTSAVYPTAQALYDGGIAAIEVTMGTPNVLHEIEKLAKHNGILPGVGSVVNTKMARESIDAGAEFVVTPCSAKEVIDTCHELNKPICSGALTPTEVYQAYEWGADIIKLFPASTFGLPYFKAVKSPMPYIPIMPTGGVTIENASEWLKHGAVCLGVGGTLVDKELIAKKDFSAITAIAKKMRNAISEMA